MSADQHPDRMGTTEAGFLDSVTLLPLVLAVFFIFTMPVLIGMNVPAGLAIAVAALLGAVIFIMQFSVVMRSIRTSRDAASDAAGAVE